jgi:mannose-6-phosphate isomerase-like protein (cupin superfamily)
MPALTSAPFVVGPADGRDAPLARLGTVHKVPAHITDGHVAIVEHTLPPRQLALPLHRHAREDELTFVLYGTLGIKLGDEVIEAGPRSWVMKPRGQWHTFWNAGDMNVRFIELLIPGGAEGYFERLSSLLGRKDAPEAEAVGCLAAQYGIEFDFQSVERLCREFDLIF